MQQVLHYSALHAAASLENDEVAKVLMHAGADVNAATQVTVALLHFPIYRHSHILREN